MHADERSEQVRRLYSLDPAQFTAERNAVAKDLKKAKRTEDAEFVASLRKPSAIEHALNIVARDATVVVERWEKALSAATEAQAAAIGGREGTAFREATADLRVATGALVHAALEYVGADAETKRAQVASAVQSLSVGNGPALLRGAIVGSAPVAAVTEFFAGAPDPPPGPRRVTAKVAKGQSRSELAKRKRWEDRRTVAMADVEQAAAALRSAEKKLATAQAQLEAVDHELRSLQ